MGQNNSNFELASEARRAAERFDECEIKVIKETFKDLCQINGGSTRIDKETFLQYLPLPGLLGERLFAVFDRKNSGEIDYEEFVCGLAVTCRGSWEEKVEFIFNLYDIHGQGAVNREELAALLNHVPKSIMRFGRAVTFEPGDHHLQHSRYQRLNHNRGTRRLPPLPHPQHPQSKQKHEQHQQPGRTHPPPPSTAGTPPSALSGHSSPVMSTAGVADTEGVPLSGVASASEGDGERGVPVESNSAEDGVVVAEGAGDELSSSPLLTSGNLMQLQLASLSPTASAMSPPSVMSAPSVGAAAEVPPGGGGGGVVGIAADAVAMETGGVLEGGAGAVRTAGDGGGLAAAASGGGMRGEEKCRRQGRRDTPVSEGSGEDLSYGAGTALASSYAAHWEYFTNNDIVEQAFEDCDLNHSGKLSFSEFRLWVERNPIVTQFLQSVFPYDEHREWGDDRKHLPFIHNREFTGSPMLSDAGGSPGDVDSSEEEARRLLIKARNTTRDAGLREGIDRLLDQHEGTSCGEEAVSKASAGSSTANGNPPLLEGPLTRRSGGNSSLLGTTPSWLFNELSPRSAKALQHQTVAKQGFLWKQGHRLRTWKQRWYVLVGNCIYYYQQEDDVYPCGVLFLTGSFVEHLQEGHNERKGFWGIEISRNTESSHRRRLYTRSKVEQLKWVKELRKASAVVPIEDDFEIGEELGKGRFSRVCMCVNKHTLERKAVKIIMKEDMKSEEKDLLRAEIAIMKLVNHPNIIRMEAVYESKKDIFIVMELHSGGELFDRIVGRPRFSEDEAFTVIHPLVESVAYLHEMGIVHRDLKPENILCGNRIGDIKIADFGLSKMVMPDEIMKMPCGTLTYVAPEVLTLNGYGKEADIWSVGTIMYLLIRGRLPFDGCTREEIIENTIHGTIAWENDHVWAGFTDDCKDLVLGMLNKDVSQRYKAKDVLRHPWITSRERRQDEHPEQFVF